MLASNAALPYNERNTNRNTLTKGKAIMDTVDLLALVANKNAIAPSILFDDLIENEKIDKVKAARANLSDHDFVAWVQTYIDNNY